MRGLIPLLIALSACTEYKLTDPEGESSPGRIDDTGSPYDGYGDGTEEPDSDADQGTPEVGEDPPDTGSPVPDGDPPTDTGSPVPDDPPVDTAEPPEVCDPLDITDSVGIDESCFSEPVTGTMEVTTEWSVTMLEGYPEYTQVISAPAVGQLTDDNGDGRIDDNDIPDIIANYDDSGTEDSAHGILRWISGDGSDNATIMDRHEDEFGDQFFPYRYAGVALGDVNGDGRSDIVTLVERVSSAPPDEPLDDPPPDEDTDHPVSPPPPPTEGEGPPPLPCHVLAIDISGDIHWISEDFVDCGGHAPALADLEGDGDVEIVVGSSIYDGVTGALEYIGEIGKGVYPAYPEIGMIPAISDLDGDGRQEILAGSTIYGPDASVICSRVDDTADGFTAAADFDGDGMGDVVIVGNNTAAVMDRNCVESALWILPGDGNGGPPTVADFDADGSPEIGIATATHYAVYEPDGEMLWSHEVTDASSHATGSTVFDFEGDGRPEVVYGDERRLWVLDGPTGAVRVSDSGHTSRTLHEFPLVVDVDNDGEPEIVVPNGGGHHGVENTGIYVVGSADGSWLGGRTTWNQHAYNIVNIENDLSIPTVPEPNWPLHNNFRSGDLNPVYGTNSPDAIPLSSVCTDECEDGIIRIGVRVGNGGTAPLRHDLKMSVYRATSPDWTLIETRTISPPIYPGDASEVISLTIASEDAGSEGLKIVVDDADGTEAVRECNEENNTVSLPEATCP